MQQHELVGESRDQVELVADKEHGFARASQAMKELEHGHLVRDVEKCRWLVEHERVTALGERARQPDALPFSTRQRIDSPLLQGRDAGRVDRRVDREPIFLLGGVPDAEMRESAERDHILRALEEANWNVSGAARALGMERTNLHKRIRALGLSRER